MCFLIHGFCIYYTDVETNECLENNGGCWQDKTANITACKVLFKASYAIYPLVVYVPNRCIYVLRIHFVGESVSALLLTVCNLREMVTAPARVIYSASSLCLCEIRRLCKRNS